MGKALLQRNEKAEWAISFDAQTIYLFMSFIADEKKEK